MSLRGAVAIAGVGEAGIAKSPTMSGLALNAVAIERALDDAGLAMRDVDGLLTAYSMTEPYFMLGSVLAEYIGIEPRYAASVTAGGATPGIALHHAAMAITTGQASTIVIAVGENRATGATRDEAVARLTAVGHPAFENPYGPLVPAFYAMVAQRYLHDFSVPREALANVAVAARHHAVLHPDSPMSREITVEDVLGSKPIAEPLNLLDCCLISDAAGALVVTDARRARDLPRPLVRLLGIGECHTHEHLLMAPDDIARGARRAGADAYAMAGLGPGDVQLAELYDCFTVVPPIEAEALGLAEPGAGTALFSDGASRFDGSLPVNTHGGLLSYAQAGASGGMHGIIEAVRQIRGEAHGRQTRDHDVALVHNEGGVLSAH